MVKSLEFRVYISKGLRDLFWAEGSWYTIHSLQFRVLRLHDIEQALNLGNNWGWMLYEDRVLREDFEFVRNNLWRNTQNNNNFTSI